MGVAMNPKHTFNFIYLSIHVFINQKYDYVEDPKKHTFMYTIHKCIVIIDWSVINQSLHIHALKKFN